MANNLTDVAERLVLDWLDPALAAPTRPTAPLKVRLWTVSPAAETGTGGTEVTGGAYAMQTIGFGAASTDANNVTTKLNTGVVFPTATANWGTVVAITIQDSAATPVVLFVGPLTVSQVVNSGSTFQLAAGLVRLSND